MHYLYDILLAIAFLVTGLPEQEPEIELEVVKPQPVVVTTVPVEVEPEPVIAALCENYHAQLTAEFCPEGWVQVGTVINPWNGQNG